MFWVAMNLHRDTKTLSAVTSMRFTASAFAHKTLMRVVLMTPRPVVLLFTLTGMLPIVIFPMFFFQILMVTLVFVRVPLVIVFVAVVIITMILIMIVMMILSPGIGANAETADKQET